MPVHHRMRDSRTVRKSGYPLQRLHLPTTRGIQVVTLCFLCTKFSLKYNFSMAQFCILVVEFEQHRQL
ncbi:hypothetical protein POVWA2_033970 [Plasmodium ovale wallikeri]|uniref:Uncharacterized protein n=1 Tax=Plasmodium ovale wallikeri TaxID=864142 RepID=A0A1A8YYR4_PLAOA|nr:hypothetical protein POVWA1_034810 [Plasmodium ovale wallikeri]SBT37526.1 hypothetical protein POVWA2_033970 [Plasmodium ovale wallikeri]